MIILTLAFGSVLATGLPIAGVPAVVELDMRQPVSRIEISGFWRE